MGWGRGLEPLKEGTGQLNKTGLCWLRAACDGKGFNKAVFKNRKIFIKTKYLSQKTSSTSYTNKSAG